MVSLTGCQKKELATDPLKEAFSLAGIAPNPVMRGGALNIYGRGLDQVAEVHFAGENISVSEFVKLSKGTKLDTLQVLVPLEGPEVGKVSIVTADGRSLVSMTDLSFTEPIGIEKISPLAVVSRDVITITGEYLNVVKEVIFSGENAVVTEFESQSRHELKVKVPASAVDGPIILSDVNELVDQSTIPNHVYSSQELVLGQPTVKKAAKATYKVGDKITVTGSHLDMIKTVNLPGAEAVAFTYKEEASAESIEFALPATALAGTISLVSFESDEFDGGEYEVVVPTNVVAAPQPVKAGEKLTITGKNLELVSKVNLENAANVEFSYEEEKITLTVPESAQEGKAVLALASGFEVPFEFTLVKPVVTAFSANPVPAGSALTIEGTDLDLVSSVTFGGDVTVEVEAEEKSITVDVPTSAESGKLVLNLKNGSTVESEDLAVDKPAGAFLLAIPEDVFKVGDLIVAEVVNGEHLEKVLFDAVEAKFMVNGSKLCVFVPEGAKKGSLLILVSDNGTVSYPVNIDPGDRIITTIWSGSSTVTWGGGAVQGLSWGGYDWSTVKAGMVLRAILTVDSADAAIRFGNGNWATIPSGKLLGDGDGNIPLATDATSCAVTLTQEDIDFLVDNHGLVVCGTGYTITQIELIELIPQETTIWSGSSTVTWSGGAVQNLSWGGYDWSTVKAGTGLIAHYTIDEAGAAIRFGNGNWATVPSGKLVGDGDGNITLPEGSTSYAITLTQEDIDFLVANNGLVVCGTGYTITSIGLLILPEL